MPMRNAVRTFATTLALAVLAMAPSLHAAAPPNIAATSSLQFALTEIAESFQRSTGHNLNITFGSTGQLRKQIADGAPFEMFLSADEGAVEALAAEGRTEDAGVRFATGRIVLFVPTGSPLKPDATLADLGAAAKDGRLRRLAMPNPEQSAYGRAAREALQKAGIWLQVTPKVAVSDNAAQAAQMAASGGAQAGIVPIALARSPAMAGKGTVVLLSSSLHAPLHQRMVLTKRAGPVARSFFAYLQQPAARAVFRRYGFLPPES